VRRAVWLPTRPESASESAVGGMPGLSRGRPDCGARGKNYVDSHLFVVCFSSSVRRALKYSHCSARAASGSMSPPALSPPPDARPVGAPGMPRGRPFSGAPVDVIDIVFSFFFYKKEVRNGVGLGLLHRHLG
jgi:hypothetical protein